VSGLIWLSTRTGATAGGHGYELPGSEGLCRGLLRCARDSNWCLPDTLPPRQQVGQLTARRVIAACIFHA
jgi:hypothetical protein